MEQYLEHAKKILTDSSSGYKPNRTGVDSISRFGHQNEYDLQKGLPLLTTKRVPPKAIIHELFWFMKGETNIKYLIDNNVHIWDEWGFERYLKATGQNKDCEPHSPEWYAGLRAYAARIKDDAGFAEKHGDLGPVYGRQWRNWRGSDGEIIDQLSNILSLLKKSPTSRRMIMSAWNPTDVPNMALPPCHTLWHLNVLDGKLDLQLYQRSCDMFLGVPFNIASYALLTHILANEADLEPGRFIHSFGDAHFYCGKGARGAFYGEHLDELKNRMLNAMRCEEETSLAGKVDRSEYLAVRDWIAANAPAEEHGHERKDHVPLILEQLSREPRALPAVSIAKKPYDELTIDDIVITGYHPHPTIKGEVAV